MLKEFSNIDSVKTISLTNEDKVNGVVIISHGMAEHMGRYSWLTNKLNKDGYHASVDTIVSSNGQEDHVSMGANAAIQAYQILENVERILAIELLNASQALFFRKKKTSPFLSAMLCSFRAEIPKVTEDRVLHNDIEKAIKFIQSFELENEVLFD